LLSRNARLSQLNSVSSTQPAQLGNVIPAKAILGDPMSGKIKTFHSGKRKATLQTARKPGSSQYACSP
jgi:hypothetical protein